MFVRGINFTSVSTIFLLEFGTVATVCINSSSDSAERGRSIIRVT
jgi:hypothetical protein